MGMRLTLSAAAALSAAACSQPTETVIQLPPPAAGPAATSIVQDVDFLRGCWVERDSYGFVTATLRLLPAEGPNSASLEGRMQRFNRSELISSLTYTASRDGRLFAIDYPDSNPRTSGRKAWRAARPQPDLPHVLSPAAHRAVFNRSSTAEAWLIAESEGDRLVLFNVSEDGFGVGDFDGRRDGCD